MSVCAIRSGAVICFRGLNPIHIDELGALTKPRVCPIPTGLHHAILTLPKLKELFYPLAGLSGSLMQQQASEPDNLPS